MVNYGSFADRALSANCILIFNILVANRAAKNADMPRYSAFAKSNWGFGPPTVHQDRKCEETSFAGGLS